ncbi:MAG TPA: class D sortase [Bryobacteraceae bacterium]|jgi:sortase A|nr:class D sortase [Bryobacteraceae bacterium]
MIDSKTPYIVRAQPAGYIRPGQHSHNTGRRRPPNTKKHHRGGIYNLRLLLLILGLCGIGYYGYTICDQYLYQSYENWAFDQAIAGRTHVNFSDYVRERTPFGFLTPSKPGETTQSARVNSTPAPMQPRPAEGAILGRVEIARLNLAAVVREGVDAKVLSVAVGHVPSTAMPGQPGNFAIAAHRDTLFRVLKDIQQGDLVSFQAPSGTYTYKVVATKIVRPADVTVLRPDGGGLIPHSELVSNDGHSNKLLTMITCYPFYYVGSAPKRFIVEAELVGQPGAAQSPAKRLS